MLVDPAANIVGAGAPAFEVQVRDLACFGEVYRTVQGDPAADLRDRVVLAGFQLPIPESRVRHWSQQRSARSASSRPVVASMTWPSAQKRLIVSKRSP